MNPARKFYTHIFLWIMLTSHNCFGIDLKMTQCLGQEEKKIHIHIFDVKWSTLNRELISMLIQNQNLVVEDKIFKKVCAPGENAPSYQFFKALVLQGSKVFTITAKNEITKKMQQRQKRLLLKQWLPKLFNIFVVTIKQRAPSAHCLQQNIPFLEDLFLELKYLKGDHSFDEIINRNNRAEELFKRVDNIQEVFSSCSANSK